MRWLVTALSKPFGWTWNVAIIKNVHVANTLNTFLGSTRCEISIGLHWHCAIHSVNGERDDTRNVCGFLWLSRKAIRFLRSHKLAKNLNLLCSCFNTVMSKKRLIPGLYLLVNKAKRSSPSFYCTLVLVLLTRFVLDMLSIQNRTGSEKIWDSEFTY